jgi:tRNA(His) 5'-end guanylyltransferase
MKMYENSYKPFLPRKLPVILRLDGKAFHQLTKTVGFEKPYDAVMMSIMTTVAITLATEIQNAKFLYMQSDEISVLMHDLDSHETEAWFSNNLQKIVSVSAGITTAAFRDLLHLNIKQSLTPEKGVFDSRAFIIPREDVCNYFIWRQQDATRNSIQGWGRKFISHRDIQGLNNDQVQDKLFNEYEFNWNDCPTWQKRGWCVYKDIPGNWITDLEPPIFSKDPGYVNTYVDVEW